MSRLSEFYDPKKDIDNNPIDYFNEYGCFEDIFSGSKEVVIKDNELQINMKAVAVMDGINIIIKDNFKCKVGQLWFSFKQGRTYTRFKLLTKVKYNHNHQSAYNNINFEVFGTEIPYLRIGVDYYKKTIFPDLYKNNKVGIIPWKKDEITQDHGKPIFSRIPKFDGSVMRPDNIDYKHVINGYYNWYAPFQHTQYDGEVTEDMIPASMYVMKHIFGEQLEQGLKYFKILYEHPKQRTFVLCLVSKTRGTGKTTFLNWLDMIFLDNFVTTDITTLEGQFNSGYVTKNIIALDEAVTGDKSTVVEKLKKLVLAPKVPVNEKHIRHYQLDFFAKIIFCSNKETDFIRIDKEEDRIWLRKINKVPESDFNSNIETELKKEIPMFLKYILQLPALDLGDTSYRFVMTPKEVWTPALGALKKGSMPELYKEIYIAMKEYFNNEANNLYDEIKATPTDLKEKLFPRENNWRPSYIEKVLKQDFEMQPSNRICRYKPFNLGEDSKTGKCYTFTREKFGDSLDNIDNGLPF